MNKLKLLASVTALVSASVASQAAIVDYAALQDLFQEPVTLSATGKPQRASDAPVSMDIIDEETIRRSDAQDIPEILRRYAGVDVRRNYTGSVDVGIRGTNQHYSNRLLVLVNGRQVYQDHYGVTYWSALPVTLPEIRQIEIVRGPNTSLFGFNAAAGVVNIITKSPLLDDEDVVQVRLGTQNHQEATAVMTHKVSDNLAARISVNLTDREGYSGEDLAVSTDKDFDGLGRRTVNLHTEYQMQDGGVLRFEANQSRIAADMLLPYHTTSDSARTTSGVKLEYSKDHAFGLATLTGYYNSYSAPTAENDLYVVKAENLAKLNEAQTLRVAAEFRNNQVKSNLLDGDSTDAIKYDVASVSAMHDWSITDKLSWTNAARFDHLKLWRNEDPAAVLGGVDYAKEDFTRSIDGYSFNTGLLYKASDVDTYRASISRGLRVPALLQFGITNLAGGAFPFYGNPNLDTEEFMNYELGYTHRLPEIHGQFSASVFHQTITNVIADATFGAVLPGPTPTIGLSWQNAGDTSSTGIELDFKAKPLDNLEYGINYSFIRFDDEQDSQATRSEVVFENNAAQHHANLWGRYTMDKWEFDGALHYVSARDYLAQGASTSLIETRVPDYFMLNARVGYNISDNTSVSIKGYNLLEEHYETPSFNTVAGLAGSAEIGRSAFVTLTHKF